MKRTLPVVCLLSLSGLSVFGRPTPFSCKPDTVPAQQRYHFTLASDNSPRQPQWATVFFYPAKSQLRNEFSLPVGFNPTTLRVSSGNRVLVADEDYVFILNTNRIRVLDEESLTAQQPIKIMYEGIARPADKRLLLRYKP